MRFAQLSSLDRYVALAGVILWGTESTPAANGLDGLAALDEHGAIVKMLQDLLREIKRDAVPSKEQGIIWQISLNRKAMPALQKSVPAVKGDAVLDSGIDGNHPAFYAVPSGPEKPSEPRELRIIKAYDFRNIRKIVSLDNEDIDKQRLSNRLKELLKGRKLDRDEAISDLKTLAEDAGNDRPIYWELVEKFITTEPTVSPAGAHGTHVAGIIGAHGTDGEGDGMCPDIKLLDFRVLGKTLEDTEFAIIAALQFIRYLNERNGYIAVHGANLSLSIPHDVRNFACGRTPICHECERLVDSGVVVVVAAGNLGYQSFETKEGAFDTYAAFSITDPGNADGVITVGATHRFWPHTYGVSFFSSRGPTGDGRLKPDIVAPGERIRSCMVSHIDDDHINGILELTKELVTAADEKKPLPLKIRSFWHNSFDDIVGNNPKELLAAVTASFGAAGMNGELDFEGFDADTARVLASAAQGFHLRDDARKLKLPINKEFGAKLVMAEGETRVDFGKGLQFTVVGPMKTELLALQKEHDAFLKKAKEKAAKAALAAFTDNSVANLSSIVVLAETNGKRMLLTGDARGDKILEGLEKVKLLKPRGKMHVDILKVPHHGSSRNMEPIFFERIIADHYVFSGNGEHGNPDRETLQMLSDARGAANFSVYLTYSIDEIDVARKADWEEEQAKERARKTRNPNVKVRKNWSPKENSLMSFLAAHQEFARKVAIVTGENQFVIDLHEKLNY